MIQPRKTKAILFHLYPGVIITLGFTLLAPIVIAYGFPPQFAMLVSIALITLPLLIGRLFIVKRQDIRTACPT